MPLTPLAISLLPCHFRLGIGPDGKQLPIPNTRKLFPRMYPVMVVNQDGSTYQIRHCTPHCIITLPLDPATLTEEERKVIHFIQPQVSLFVCNLGWKYISNYISTMNTEYITII